MKRAWHAGLAAILVAVLWFGTLEFRGLFFPDEGRYAEIPQQMVASGDWVTPRLNGLKYFEKPPLKYWLTAASFQMFGSDEWTARLPGALLGLLGVAFTGFCAWRIWNRRTGWFAAAVLGSAWGYFLASQYLTLDISVSVFLGAGLCAFLLSQSGGRHATRWMLLAWAAAGLAVLAKGLIGVVIPGMALCVYALLRGDYRVFRRLEPLKGALLLLAIAAPWFVLVQQRNPEFFEFFFINEHFRRYASSGHHRAGAWWYYLPILLVGLMPWTATAIRGVWSMRWAGVRGDTSFSPAMFCVGWIGSILVFFSFSHSKLPAYILPALPAIALLVARRLDANWRGELKWCAWSAGAAAIALGAGTALLPAWPKFSSLTAHHPADVSWLLAACGFLLAGAVSCVVFGKRRPGIATAALAMGSVLFIQGFLTFFHTVDERFSAERLVESITPKGQSFRPEAPFYSVASFDHSVPFYLRRPVTLVATRGELGPGIDAEPSKAIASIDEFAAVWMRLEGQAFAIFAPAILSEMQAMELPLHIVARDPFRVIVSRRKEEIPRFPP